MMGIWSCHAVVSMARSASLLLSALAMLGTQALLALPAAPPAWSADPDYPSQELLRQLQLDIMACGRDNQAEACRKARDSADPLLDHPRLSGSCKDSLWQIGQEAVVVPENTYQRREALTNAANDVIRFCRQQDHPIRSGSNTPAASPRRSGFGFIQ